MNKRHLFNKQAITDLRAKARGEKPVILYSRITYTYSIYFSALLTRLGLTPNIVTLFMILSGVLGSTFFLSQAVPNSLLGVFFFNLWFILDCSDGEVARITGKASVYGTYLDKIAHWVTHHLMILSISYHYSLGCEDGFLYLVFGGLYIAANFMSRDLKYLIDSCLPDNVSRKVAAKKDETRAGSRVRVLHRWYHRNLHAFPNLILYFTVLYIVDLLIPVAIFGHPLAGLCTMAFFILEIFHSYITVGYTSYKLWKRSNH